MDTKQIAAALNNISYPVRIDRSLLDAAKASGVVIVYGASDDIMRFDGAITDEIGCYNGGSALVDAEGLLPERESIDDDAELEAFFNRKRKAQIIEAVWCDESDNYPWTYQTEIPHETFEVIEDDDKYCRGIVFALDDLAAVNP